MGLLLDTNILSTHLKRPDLTFSKFTQHGGRLCTSQIVVAKLYAWCFTFGDPHERAPRWTGCSPMSHRWRSANYELG